MSRLYATVLWVVCVMLCLPALTMAQEVQRFVPKQGAAVTDLALVVEWHPIGRQTQSLAAKRLAAELAQRLDFAFRKSGASDRILFRGFCLIILRDPNPPNEPDFQIGCTLWDGRHSPFQRLPKTPEEVVKDLKEWMDSVKTSPEKVYPERPQLEPIPVYEPRPPRRPLV